jgi:hypothetical protein
VSAVDAIMALGGNWLKQFERGRKMAKKPDGLGPDTDPQIDYDDYDDDDNYTGPTLIDS